MNKKLLWTTTLCAALALLVTACPGSGDPEEVITGDDGPKGSFWLASDDTGEVALTNNRKTLRAEEASGTAYVHVFFDPYGDTFERLSIEFTLTETLNLMWQCAYDGTEGAVWARSSSDLDFIDTVTPGAEQPAVCRPARVFTGGNWGDDPLPAGVTGLDLATMRGVCIQIPNAEGVFTLKNVSFIR